MRAEIWKTENLMGTTGTTGTAVEKPNKNGPFFNRAPKRKTGTEAGFHGDARKNRDFLQIAVSGIRGFIER